MSVSTRRTLGLIAAIAVLIAIAAYSSWRITVASERGWTGMSYLPPMGAVAQGGGVAGLQPGSVFMVYPGAPADRMGLQRGDQILAVNGIAARNIHALQRVSQTMKRGDPVRYRFSRNGAVREVQGRLASPMSSPMFAVSFSTSIAEGIAFLIIGAFVFWRRPADSRAVLFYAMTLIAAIAFANAAVSQADATNMRGISVAQSVSDLWRLVAIGAAGLFFAPILLHLALVFPKERPVMRYRRQVLLWAYGYPAAFLLFGAALITFMSALDMRAALAAKLIVAVSAAAAVISLIVIIVKMARRGFKEGLLHSPIAANLLITSIYAALLFFGGFASVRTKSIMPVFAVTLLLVAIAIATFATYAVATFVALFRSYRESGVEERRQVKWPIWATMVAVGGKIVFGIIGIALLFSPVLAHGSFGAILYTLPEVVSKLLYILIPLSFAFAILKYRLMNIDVVIRRTVLYSILTFVVFALYAVLVASVGTALVKFAGLTSQTMLVASTVVIALAAVPIRNRLQRMVDRNLFREKRDFALALRNIGNAIGGGNADEFLRQCAEQIQQALQNRLVIILVRRDQEFVATAKVGVADEIIGRVRATAQDDSALRKLGAALIIPTRHALLAVGTKLSDEDFSAEDREFLDSAAAQIALGIENVRLRVEEVEFEQARAMQQILLPTHFPQLNGFEISGMWHPARSVGGDYFDTFALGASQAAICIGDVAGKGMPAALLMANLQAAVKATASPSAAPAMVCERIKQIVGGNLQGGKFISFFYGVLDATSHTFTYSNAGHNPPILVRANGDVDRLDRGGPAICRLFRDIPQEQGATQLGAGDRIVLFTDGATEARRGEEDFGDDRLIQLILAHPHLGARELQERIMAELRDFTGGDFGDDVTLVVIVVR